MTHEKEITLFLAHCDDELVSCYWFVKHYGKRITKVVFVTNSSVEIPEPTMPTEEYICKRRKESVTFLRANTNTLQNNIVFLNYPDHLLSNFYKTDKILDQMANIIEERKDTIWLIPNPHDLHPDHSFIGQMLIKLKKENIIVYGLKNNIITKSVLLENFNHLEVDGKELFKNKMRKLRTFFNTQMENLLKTGYDFSSDEFYLDVFGDSMLWDKELEKKAAE